MLHYPFGFFHRFLSVLSGITLMVVLLPSGVEARKPIRLFFETKISKSAEKSWEYTVQKGDWLYKILRENGFSKAGHSSLIARLHRLNPDISDFDKLVPGQVLILPMAEKGPVTDTKSQAQKVKTHKPPKETSLAVREYIVRTGDTLIGILQRASGLSKANIYQGLLPRFHEMNPDLNNINMIYPGQRILIPTSSTPAPTSTDAATPLVQMPDTSKIKKSRVTLSVSQYKYLSMLMLKEVGFSFTPGETILFPDTNGGWFSVDLNTTPVCKAPWGATILMGTEDPDFSQKPGRSPLKILRLSDWAPETVIKTLAETFPGHVSFHPDELISQGHGRVNITVKAPYLFSVKSNASHKSFGFAPILPRNTGLSSLIWSYLAQNDIIITEMRVFPSGEVTLSSQASLPQNSLYIPEIQAVRAASELADFFGPSELSATLQAVAKKSVHQLHALQDSGLLKPRVLDLRWTANGLTISIDIPALVIEQNGTKIALLDQAVGDSYLMSLVALKGYTCFHLLTH